MRWGGARTAADFPEPEIEVWDENYEQLIWFRSMLSQFHYNGFGATGFDYNVAYRDFADMGITGQALDEWKWKMKVMEQEVLRQANKPA